MPLYEYSCQKCNHGFEALVFDNEKIECPECHGNRVERLLSLPAKPRSEGPALPMRCASSGPPCGAPGCMRS
jgi:putative FmdB family regulatory protein